MARWGRAAAHSARALPLLRRAVATVRDDGLTEALQGLVPANVEGAPAVADPEAARIARSVVRAARLVPGADCLPQAVVISALLARAGATAELVLGCKRSGDGEWLAHAWVALGELTLPAGGDDGFRELARCRAADGWRPARAGDPARRPSGDPVR